MKHLYLFITLTILICSCKSENETNENTISEWIGKNVIFPSDIQSSNYNSLKENKINLDKEFKVLTYIDSIGCIACKLKMHLWKDLIKEFEDVTKDNISFIFIINSNNYKEINYILKESDFKYPVIFDKKDSFNQKNKFPSNIKLQTFLLNKNNNVILIGNPILNPTIKELYLKQISKENTYQTSLTKKIN